MRQAMRRTAALAAFAAALVLAWPAWAAAPAAPLTAAGLKAELARLRGQVVVLNFWGTWCSPCLKELPELITLERELAPRGVRLVAVAMDDAADIGMVESFRSKFFPALSTWVRDEPDMDTLASAVDAAWNELLPTTYLIGRDGKIARRIQGRKTLEEFRVEVLALAGPPAPRKP